ERRAPPPLAVIEPGAAVWRIGRRVAIKIADGPFEPDRRRMEATDGGKASINNAQRNDARIGRRRAHGHVHAIGVAPQSEEIRLALAESTCDGSPDPGINVKAWPRRMKSHRCAPGK